MQTFTLNTKTKDGFYDITDQVKEAIQNSGVKDGICVVFCPHTTAAITINENADDDVARDVIFALNATYIRHPEFKHNEGNSAEHVKSSAVGASETIIVEDGKPVLGVWQSIYFVEFDGPRNRSFHVKTI